MLLTSLFVHDAEHNRVDIQPFFAALLTVGFSLLYCMLLPFSFDFPYIIIVPLFSLMLKGILASMGASNISSTLIALLATIAIWPHDSEQFTVFIFYFLTLGLTFEFLKNMNFRLGLLLGAMTGFIAAMQSRQGMAMVLLIASILTGYVIWRMVLNRPSKKVFLKMIAKAVLTIALSIGVFLVLKPLYVHAFPTLQMSVPVGVSPIILAIVIGLCLRGLWATFLLKTARSPQFREQRVFLLAATLGVLCLVWAVANWGPGIFSLNFYYTLIGLGLFYWSMPLFCLVAMVLGLYMSAGIDRLLFKQYIPKVSKRKKRGRATSSAAL